MKFIPKKSKKALIRELHNELSKVVEQEKYKSVPVLMIRNYDVETNEQIDLTKVTGGEWSYCDTYFNNKDIPLGDLVIR